MELFHLLMYACHCLCQMFTMVIYCLTLYLVSRNELVFNWRRWLLIKNIPYFPMSFYHVGYVWPYVSTLD